ncbi:MAG: nucleotidyltransferase family protein [Candidatus Kariarchaeaceae archaeon]
MGQQLLQKVKIDAQRLSQVLNPLGIFIFGSFVKETAYEQSDIDICIVKPNCSIQEALSRCWRLFGNKYDFKIFEELPVFLQAEVLDHHIMIVAPSEPELYEYLYTFRRAIETYKNRLKVAYS